MKFELKNFFGNLTDAMRSAGYHYDGQDPKTKEWRFYRSLSQNLYPRFHIYGFLDKAKSIAQLSLHLDQKAPVYQGSSAHSGEYEGEIIEKEVTRIKGAIGQKPALELPKEDLF
ncbi:MAG: hypothetical protein G01um10143_836 [Parcubacteria group bacterium Gr01-1014_3]|nr:MAG: hypothetical protein G01um10143_836 [Parcubacteria group bacterium Gr01-1014_3]